MISLCISGLRPTPGSIVRLCYCDAEYPGAVPRGNSVGLCSVDWLAVRRRAGPQHRRAHYPLQFSSPITVC